MWPFGNKRRRESAARDAERREKLQASGLALMVAATEAADAAHHVTSALKHGLDDAIRQYETTVRVLKAGLLVCTQSGTIVSSNPAAQAMLERSEHELHQVNAFSLFDGPGPATDATTLAQGFAADQITARKPCGSTFPVEGSVTGLERSHGDNLLLIILHDVSLMRATAATYRALFDLVFDGVFILQDGVVVAANRAAETLFGLDCSALLGSKLGQLLQSDDPNLATAGQTRPLHADAQTDDGRIQVLVASTAIEWSGRPACLVTARNLGSQRLEVDWRAKRDAQGFNLILCLDADQVVIYANDAFCAYYGISKENVLGQPAQEVLPDAECAPLVLNLSSLTPDHPTRRVQLHTPFAGSTRAQDWVDHASFNSNGQVTEYQRIGRDITEIMTDILAEGNCSGLETDLTIG